MNALRTGFAILVITLISAIMTPAGAISPIEFQDKYEKLVRIEREYAVNMHHYKTTSFHNFTIRATEQESEWKQTYTLSYIVDPQPTAWIIWKVEGGVHPLFGMMGGFKPVSCWEWRGKKLIQVWGDKNAI